jgi:hypothetical protein
MKHFYPLIFLLLTNISVSGQEFGYNLDLKLLEHLINSKKPQEAIILSNSMLNNWKYQNSKDSVIFFKGYAYYQIKQFDSAQNYLLNVHYPDSLFNKARFYAIISTTYNKKFGLADSITKTIKNTSRIISQLNNFCKAGISLYNRDYNTFNENKQNFTFDNYLLQNEESSMVKEYESIMKHKYKSPTKAAIYSALVPGAGKWYCGKKGQAISSFLFVGLLGTISAEYLSKKGINNFFSISSLTLTGIFYTGNIYGSYYLAKTVNSQFDAKINQDIMYFLHVAIRNVYY